MKIDILDINKLIAVNNLQEVTSSHIFSSKMTFDSNGLLSNDIFGISKGDRRSTFAYIDLRRKFIHPHIYQKVIKALFRGIVFLVSGQRRYSIKDGILVEDEEGWTGLEALYKHWNEIDWSKKETANTTAKELLMTLTRDQIFIDKELVIPPAYRDVMLSGTVDNSDHVNELNSLYRKLISAVSAISQGGLFARTQFNTQLKIQETLVEIYDYFKGLISKKKGLIRKNLMGKSVDYGVRSVISSANYNHEHFEDNIVDLEHAAVPIYQCCSLFYPFIQSWLKNFFTREIINDPNIISFLDEKTGKEFTATIKDPEIQFSDKFIKKMINDYCLNPDNRHKLITITVEVPTRDKKVKELKAGLMLKGKIIEDNNTQKTLNRPITITDVLYLATVDVCEKRHVMVSRYPVGTDKGIFFSKINVQSTKNHIHVVFNGKDYPRYPDINLSIEHDKVGVQFIDTLVFSNSHCEGMGADYDGDQLSVRGIWTDEANEEAETIMNSKTAALNITGTDSKVVAKEVFESIYELTKIGKELSVKCNAYDTDKFLAMTPSDITLSFLTDIFADTVSAVNGNNTKRKKARYKTWDRIKVPKGYFFNDQPEFETTIGRFMFNKFILQGAGIIEAVGYIDSVLPKKTMGKIDQSIATLYMKDIIDRKQFNAYTDRRDTLGYWVNGMLAHTISEKMLKPLPQVEKRKMELCKKYEKELSEGNVDVMTKISNELIAYSKELLKDDEGMDMYDSGNLDFNNNYRNNCIIKGAVMNKITGSYDFISTSFMDGIDKKDLPAHANSILASQYPASISTQDAGYVGKKLIALLQMMDIDEEGTDCGTKNLIPITITKHNNEQVLYTYISEGGSEILLTEDNIKSYIGKRVKMRSPMSCLNQKICSKCAGQLFHMMGINHAGLFATYASHAALNLGLKAKHNSVVELATLDVDDIVKDI